MIAILKQYWPYIIGVLGAIGAISKFALDAFKVKEARLKIITLEKQIRDQNSPIHKPTMEEIDRYRVHPPPSPPKMAHNILWMFTILLAIAIPILSITISYNFYSNQEERYIAEIDKLSEARLSIVHKNRELENRQAQLKEEIKNYRIALQKVQNLSKQLQSPVTATIPPATGPETMKMIRELENRIHEIGKRLEGIVIKQTDNSPNNAN